MRDQAGTPATSSDGEVESYKITIAQKNDQITSLKQKAVAKVNGLRQKQVELEAEVSRLREESANQSLNSSRANLEELEVASCFVTFLYTHFPKGASCTGYRPKYVSCL